MHNRLIVSLAATFMIGVQINPVSAQQPFPIRPITLVVPYAAGGSADTLTRIIAERMQKTLGQAIVVENVAGAAGNIGTARVAKAAADGYTFGLGTWSTHVANAAIHELKFNVQRDFEPIALLARSPMVIAGKKAIPADNLQDLVAWLKQNPDRATLGTNGAGSIMHLGGALFQRQTGTQFAFVPYRGAGPAIVDLISGQIEMYIGLAADVVPQAAAGTIKALAVAAPKRLLAAPDVPTVDEAGIPSLYVSAWFGFWAPKDTPKSIIATLNNAVKDALADPTVRRRVEGDLSLEIAVLAEQTPEALSAFQRSEMEKWLPIVKSLTIKAE